MKRIKAFAKVNLYLEVSKELPNHYHYLHMVNGRLKNIYDYIYIRKSKSENIVTFSNNVSIENNICLNILNKMITTYNIKKRYNIYIKKRIPLGSGLGGGSMDAAAIFSYVLKDNYLNIPLNEQIKFLLQFGSDIPYGLYNSLCYIEGKGEIITPLDFKYEHNIYIVKPNISISTKEIFEKYQDYHKPYNKKEVIEGIKNNNKMYFINDLEKVTLNYPEVKAFKDKLNSLGLDLNVMSGSGSSFVVYNNAMKKYVLKFKLKNYFIKKTKIL